MAAVQQPLTPSQSLAVTPAVKPAEPGKHLETKANEYKAQALAVKEIKGTEDYKRVCELFKGATASIREVEAFFGPIKADAYRVWKNNCDREKLILNPLMEGKQHLGRLITAYDDEQDRLRAEEEARQRQQIAEQSQEQTINEAIALEAEGDIEGALAALDQGPGFVPAPTVASTVPKVQGMVKREIWKARLKGSLRNEPVPPEEMTQAELKEFMELVKAVAAGKVPLLALDVNWKYVNSQAKSNRKLLSYPGLEAYPQSNLSSRR